MHSPWIDEVRENLCRILYERRELVTIFNFDSDKHHGKLEEAILEAVFNGLFSRKLCYTIDRSFFFIFSCKNLSSI